jgi:plastocyanin
MPALWISLALAILAPLTSRIAPRASHVAPGVIRGHVDVRVPPRAAELRPDPGGMGMSGTHDPVDRRRSVVYLETAPRAAFEVSDDRRAEMNQRNERFVPHVLAIVAGTWVDFPNGDATYHNVFSLSKAKAFNLGRYAAGRMKSVRFERPGIVRVFCEIHSHMSAFILVFAHRYFAVTDDEGRYRLEGVPPGTYTVAVWNENVQGDPPRRTVTIGDAGGEVDVDFSIR